MRSWTVDRGEVERMRRIGKEWEGMGILALVTDEVAGYTRSRYEDRDERRGEL